jgi:hypothetical protein
MRFILALAAFFYLGAAFFHDWFLRPTCHCNISGEIIHRSAKGEENLPERLRQHVTFLALTVGARSPERPKSLQRALAYTAEQWREQRRGSVTEIDGGIALDRPGSEAGRDVIMITARGDSGVETPGANQTASGLAALIEVSRRLSHTTFKRPVRYLALVKGEDGFQNRVAAHRQIGVSTVISLGSLGAYNDQLGSQHFPIPQRWVYPTEANFVQVLGFLKDERSRGLTNIATQLFSEASALPVTCHKSWHTLRNAYLPETVAFHRAGLAAFQISDTGSYRDADLGTGLDLPDTLDYRRLAETIDGIAHIIEGIANDPGPSTSPHIS